LQRFWHFIVINSRDFRIHHEGLDIKIGW
jgi:hypothetical protein